MNGRWETVLVSCFHVQDTNESEDFEGTFEEACKVLEQWRKDDPDHHIELVAVVDA